MLVKQSHILVVSGHLLDYTKHKPLSNNITKTNNALIIHNTVHIKGDRQCSTE